MCEFEERLIPWLDRELPEDEDAELELHIRACAKCRSRIETYERTSLAVSAYCDAVVADGSRGKRSRLKVVAFSTGAVAAAAVLAFIAFHPRAHIAPPQPRVTAPAPRSSRTALAEEVPNRALREANPRESAAISRTSTAKHRSVRPLAQLRHGPGSYFSQTALQVDIPADDVLPPGAAPAGTSFVVDFAVGPDGSAQAIRVTPQLAAFERRAVQP